MNRRDVLRLTVFGALGATAHPFHIFAREFPPGYDASKELERPDWKPVFVDAHQNETLIVLSDLVVPGSKEALVNRFLDLLMSAELPETQRAFFSALSYIDGECMKRYKAAFLYVPRRAAARISHVYCLSAFARNLG